MYISRTLEPILAAQIPKREITVVTGMRRTGKTTLLRRLYDEVESGNKVFLDIENPLERKLFEEDDFNNIWANLRPFGVSQKSRAYIFLDEIQTHPPIVQAVKYLYDHYEVKFVLTGSSSFYLKNLFPESLAGRKIVFELYPLDFVEFLRFKGRILEPPTDFHDKDRLKNRVAHEKLIKAYEEYLRFGGFPQVVLDDDEEQKKRILSDIFKSYFELDVRSLAGFRQLSAFRDLMLLLLERVGSKLDISKLASAVGVSRETVYSYIAFLRDTYFIDLVFPYASSRDREVSGAKKVYVCDTGMAHSFSRAAAGNLLENSVYLNLRKYGEVRYYQRYSGPEIDFILPERKVSLEVKETGSAGDLKKLRDLGAPLGLTDVYVVSKKFVAQPGFIAAPDV